jgi:hypothetical protein
MCRGRRTDRRRRKLLFNLLADLRLLGMFTVLGLLRWRFVLGFSGCTGFLPESQEAKSEDITLIPRGDKVKKVASKVS